MHKRKKRILKYGLLIGLVMPIVIFVVFLFKTEAPLTHGKVEFHVPFKGDLTLDVYHPTRVKQLEKYPVLMYIHGGAWIMGTRLTVNNNRFNRAFNQLREEGYFVISPDYTLAEHDKTPFPNCIEDIFEAMHWVQENAEAYQFDMSNFGLLGESAGAHLAMMVSFSEPSDFNLSFEKTKVNYLIDVYGPSDLNELFHSEMADNMKAMIEKLPTSLAERLDPSRLLLGFNPKEERLKTQRFMHDLSPVNYLDTENIPTLIIHGEADQVVPINQSYLLTNLYDSLDIAYEAHYFPNVNHAFNGATEAQKERIQSIISDFVVAQER